MEPNFSGYATKYGLKCSDGRTISHPAFQEYDGLKVPLVWEHNKKGSVENILGHAFLKARPDGIYAYGYFNETPMGAYAKTAVEHGDIESLSIKAGALVERGNEVLHGKLVEVSLVTLGANPGALIDNVMLSHSSDTEKSDEAIIYTGLMLEHESPEESSDEKEVLLVKFYLDVNKEGKVVGLKLVEGQVEHLNTEDFLEHYGVKGMKWGIRRDLEGDGKKTKTKKIAKLDKKYEKESVSFNKGYVRVHNGLAKRMNPQLEGLNRRHAGVNVYDRTPEGRKKADAYLNELRGMYEQAAKDVMREDFGTNASGTRELKIQIIDYPDSPLGFTWAGDIVDVEHSDSEGENTMADSKISDVWNTMNDEQKEAVAYLVSEALQHSDDSDEDEDEAEEDESDEDEDETEEDETEEDEESTDSSEQLNHSEDGTPMTRNIFENQGKAVKTGATLTHDQLQAIATDAHEMGSYKKAFLAHADEYGITDIDLLFPDAKTLQDSPEWIKRRTEWVSKVLGGTHHSPFAKVKTLSADITHEEARAKGYIKGNLKKDEFFGLKKRTTGPKTIYKKQKLDRDDIIDITDLDVVAWLKAEMRLMLEEEIARAILFGDGRAVDDEDKIQDPAGAQFGEGIRSIAHDHDFYAHKVTVPANASGESRIEAVLRQMEFYRGSGSPSYYTTRAELTDLLLLKDRLGRRLYSSASELASAMGVSEVVPVDVPAPDGIVGIVVNLRDYTVGANKGGETSFFDNFDIDYNQFKYLYETRLSGGLTRYKAALVIRRDEGTQVTPLAPSFDAATNTITIPSTAGVIYMVNEEEKSGSVVITEDVVVEAVPDEGYYFTGNSTVIWEFSFNG